MSSLSMGGDIRIVHLIRYFAPIHGSFKPKFVKFPLCPRKRVRYDIHKCIMEFVDSTLHVYNCFRLYLQYNLVLLFTIYKSLYDSRT